MQNRKLMTLAAILSLFGFILGGCAATQQAAVPDQTAADDSWKFHDIVDAQFVAKYAKVPMQEDVMIIDSRPFKPKYVKGHIPMAVNIPNTQFDKLAHMLPENKDALLVFYCGGVHCKLSHKSAYKAEALGYRNVKVFAAGYPEWMSIPGNYASVSVEWVKKQLDSQTGMMLIDSRPKRKKYDKGHISGAVSIPDSQFAKMTDQLPGDKEKLLVFYCGGFHCKLSHKSAKKALDLGYKNVKVFAAGYPAWKAYTGGNAPTQVKPGKEEGSIDIVTFKKIVKENPKSIYLIDVRDPDEFALGSFKTAVNIPVDDLEAKIKSLPGDIPVVFVCSTGARSGESFYMVQDLRPELKNVFYLEAGVIFKKDGSYELTEPEA